MISIFMPAMGHHLIVKSPDSGTPWDDLGATTKGVFFVY